MKKLALPDKYKQGSLGEFAYWKLLKRTDPDIIVQQIDSLNKLPNGTYEAVEVKFKETFTPPPFYGHGTNVEQIKRREMLRKDKGIRTKLVILSLDDDSIYWQYIDVLQNGEFYDTYNGCRIYPLSAYNRYEIPLSDVYKGQDDFERGIDLHNQYKALSDGAKEYFDYYYKEDEPK